MKTIMKTMIILNINVDIEEKLRICPENPILKKSKPYKIHRRTKTEITNKLKKN